jgi:hypothetical protein
MQGFQTTPKLEEHHQVLRWPCMEKDTGTSETTEIMVRLKQIQEAAALNAEALRKLVKKLPKKSNYPLH